MAVAATAACFVSSIGSSCIDSRFNLSISDCPDRYSAKEATTEEEPKPPPPPPPPSLVGERRSEEEEGTGPWGKIPQFKVV